jgi:beta-lactamase class A
LTTEYANVNKLLESFVNNGSDRSVVVKIFRGPDCHISIRGEVARPLASVIKLAVVMTAYDLSQAGFLDMDETITVGELGTTRYNSLLAVFDKCHKFSLRELCALILATSNNVASRYLLGLLGHRRINEFLSRNGCVDTILNVGYDDADLSSAGRRNVGTANDMMHLLTQIQKNPLYVDLLTAMENGVLKNRIPLRLPNDLKVVNKTGSLEGVANDAGIIRSDLLEVGIVVLTDSETDTALTGLEIGDLTFELWGIFGGRTNELQ